MKYIPKQARQLKGKETNQSQRKENKTVNRSMDERRERSVICHVQIEKKKKRNV